VVHRSDKRCMTGDLQWVESDRYIDELEYGDEMTEQ
jgi:hypothetical protein